MIVKLLTEQHLELLSLIGGCRGSSESTHFKISNLMPRLNWYKSYVLFHCHNIDHSNNNNRLRCLGFSTKIRYKIQDTIYLLENP